MPRPKVERGARSLRLPLELDQALAKKADSLGISVNEATERAVRIYLDPSPPAASLDANPALLSDATRSFKPRARTVTPRFKK